jgi:hypothetical protein
MWANTSFLTPWSRVFSATCSAAWRRPAPLRSDGFVAWRSAHMPSEPARELTQVLDAIVGAQHVDFAVPYSTPE